MKCDAEDEKMARRKNDEFFEAFHRFHKLNISCVFSGITNSEFATLKAILACERRNRMTGNSTMISDVVRELCAPPSAVSRTLRTLEERNLILRSVNKSDRRNTMVELTDDGQKILYDTERSVNEFLNRIFEKTGQEEIDQVVKIMKHIYEVAQKEIELYKIEQKSKRQDSGK